MTPNHSIDVEAERKLFDAWADSRGLYSHARASRWEGWLAAKRSIAANTGTIDSDEFRQKLGALMEACECSGRSEASEERWIAAHTALIAHIDARLNAAEAK